MTEIKRTNRIVNRSFYIPEGLQGYQYAEPILREDAGNGIDEDLDDTSSLSVENDDTYDINDPDETAGNDDYIPTTNGFTVVSQIVRIADTGEQYVDVVVDIDDFDGVKNWEIRVAKI